MPVVVLSAGYGATVQDCGRFGFRAFGVPIAGALDNATLRVLNLLVGNDEGAAGLEMTSGRLRLEFGDNRLIAWSGGEFDIRIGTVAVPQLHAARVSAGAVCEVWPKRGRAWLTISGGIDVLPVLASRSTDLRARFGGFEGRALRDGDELPLGLPSATAARIKEQMRGRIADWSAQPLPSSRDPATSRRMRLRLVRGKNWNDQDGARLLDSAFRIAMDSDRMGLRLEASTITPHIVELVSEAVAPGTVQLPPDGEPIVLLADCQTIGGYPKIAHVITVDLARAAQLQPMDEVRFELTSLDHAQQLLHQRERDIAILRAGLLARFG